jgi:archaellum component FlaF (FlaF/FlaG flagellin family)
MTFIFKLKSDTTMTTLVAVLYLAIGYFAVAFILNLILMLVNGEKATAGIILNVIVLILFAAIFVILYRSFSRVQDNTAAREKRMRELRMTGVKVSGLTYLTTDQEIIAAIRKFKDDIDNSSSRGNENTQAIEEQLDQQIDIIRTLLTNGADNEAVLRALRGAEGLLKQRNQLLIIR